MPSGKNLILIGYRGSGKSAVGRLVAERSGRPFVDTDELIEHSAGRTIREIFESNGEAEFRRLERETIERVAALAGYVISVGGGAVLDAENRRALRAAGLCVWLTATPEELFRRIQGDSTSADRRPALTNASGWDELRQLLAEREPFYRELADCPIDTVGRTVDEAAAMIVEFLDSIDGQESAED